MTRKEYYLKNKEKDNATSKAWRIAHPNYRKDYYRTHKAKDNATSKASSRVRVLKRHGMTLAQYEHLYTTQMGKCAICYRDIPNSKSQIDHCHATGIVRGLLCTQCNTILGMAHDDVRILRHAINYLSFNRQA